MKFGFKLLGITNVSIINEQVSNKQDLVFSPVVVYQLFIDESIVTKHLMADSGLQASPMLQKHLSQAGSQCYVRDPFVY